MNGKVPHERYPQGKKKVPTIAHGRLQEDIRMTTQEIEYHTHIQDWYSHMHRPDMIQQQERIISERKKHLKRLKEKMR